MAHKLIVQTDGGQYATTVAAAASGNALINSNGSAVNSGAGMLHRIITLSNDINTTTFYDNTTGPGGNVLFKVPANTAVGTIYQLQIPVANGIWAGGVVNSISAVVTWSNGNTYGN
jgi:hypothetical protein